MPAKVDITNKRYGKWVIIKLSHCKSGDRYWLCRCDCGAERLMAKKTLNRGKLKPCTCDTLSSEVNMIGKKFGTLTVVSLSTTNAEREYDYNCTCDCGNKTIVYAFNLLSGSIQSCGCFYRESNSKHGYASLFKGKTDEYICWIAIKQRCNDKNSDSYHNYGGRGIKVCERWTNSFEDFLADMGNKPTPKHSIDRFPDVNGDYGPTNCRWATPAEQGANKRSNVWLTYNGKSYIQSDLAKLLGIPNSTLCHTLKKKSLEDTIAHCLKNKSHEHINS